MSKKRVMFISSGGGHLEELLMLRSLFEDCEYLLVSEKTDTTAYLKDRYNTEYLLYGTKDHLLKYLFVFPFNILLSLFIYLKFRPEYIVTTGTHTAVPMCFIGHYLGSKVVWIETFANVSTPTKAGRIAYRVADKFIVQWPDLLEVYPGSECWGSIF